MTQHSEHVSQADSTGFDQQTTMPAETEMFSQGHANGTTEAQWSTATEVAKVTGKVVMLVEGDVSVFVTHPAVKEALRVALAALLGSPFTPSDVMIVAVTSTVGEGRRLAGIVDVDYVVAVPVAVNVEIVTTSLSSTDAAERLDSELTAEFEERSLEEMFATTVEDLPPVTVELFSTTARRSSGFLDLHTSTAPVTLASGNSSGEADMQDYRPSGEVFRCNYGSTCTCPCTEDSVIRAWYGQVQREWASKGFDVTSKVRMLLGSSTTASLEVSIEHFGDPAPGEHKLLAVEYHPVFDMETAETGGSCRIHRNLPYGIIVAMAMIQRLA